jgi:hypothetical protein
MRTRKLLVGGGAGAGVLVIGLVSAALAGAQAPAPPQAPLTPAQAQSLSANVTRRVIVVMRNQLPGVSSAPASLPTREADTQQVQQPVISELDQTHAQDVQPYTTVDAVSATVSPGEETRLQANPAVSEVIPDALIPLGSPSASASSVASSLGANALPGACAPPGQVQLDPQALQTIGADSQVPGQPTARTLGITGAGVTVAFIADGLDIDNPDFIRADGTHVFVDYKDFSGEGTSVATGGGEAFLDASSIAAQGRETYDVSHYSDLPLNHPCLIRVEGVAPGASLVGLDIFGAEDAGYSSSFLQAIDYAVTVDNVNVLNESLGNNFYPDDAAALDLIKQANDAAVAAGTTVVVSSGDAGVTSTIGTPATDPEVIDAGASTTYRLDAQIGYGGARFPGVSGWLDNNISSLSSGGFTQSGSTVTLVAPGELNWALCSTDVALYSECTNFTGAPSPVQETGGTSESAPLTAGVVALVIQAYAQTHAGIKPTPAVIKQILTSTADDIGAPADQQGSGIVDAYHAVLAAEAYGQPTSAPTTSPGTLLQSTGQFNASGAPGSVQKLTETVTNNGSRPQVVSLSTRAIGSYSPIRNATVNLSDSGPHMTDWQGITDNVQSVSFAVPAGVNRLNTAIAFQNASATDLTARVRLTLVDANGDLAGYSVPQGDGNYGDIQVTNPVPGHWTAYIYSRDSADGGTTGPVVFGASVASYTQFGSVWPSTLVLAPGQSAPATLTVSVPNTPGDSAGALVLSARSVGSPPSPSSGAPSVTSVPVTLRSFVPAGNASFKGVLTGGNGRQFNDGQTFYYQVNVAAGQPELNAAVTLANNPDNQTYAWLIDPSGNAEAFASNGLVTTDKAGNVTYTNTLGSNLHVLAPAAGTWTLIVLFAPQVSGTALSEPFTVAVNQQAVSASAPGLPDSARTALRAGKPVSVNVLVHNSGPAPEAYFPDGRLSSSTQYDLAAVTGSSTTVPLNVTENFPFYIVPTDTTNLDAVAQTSGTENIQFDTGTFNGDPDLASSVGTSVAASYSANPVTQGPWDIAPTTVGPFGPTGATPEDVDTAMLATTLAFDPALTSPLGDLWLSALDPTTTFGAVIVSPGHTGTVPVTITPTGARGTVLSGTLYIDDESLVDFGSLVPDGNQVAALPYSYRIR